jgi:hypothetical protein
MLRWLCLFSFVCLFVLFVAFLTFPFMLARVGGGIADWSCTPLPLRPAIESILVRIHHNPCHSRNGAHSVSILVVCRTSRSLTLSNVVHSRHHSPRSLQSSVTTPRSQSVITSPPPKAFSHPSPLPEAFSHHITPSSLSPKPSVIRHHSRKPSVIRHHSSKPSVTTSPLPKAFRSPQSTTPSRT